MGATKVLSSLSRITMMRFAMYYFFVTFTDKE